MSRVIFEAGNPYIELIKEVQVKNRDELNKHEGEAIRTNKDIIVNKRIAGRNSKEYYKDHKGKIQEYQKEHKGKINEYHKEYYKEYKGKINEYQKEYYKEHKDEIIEKTRIFAIASPIIH